MIALQGHWGQDAGYNIIIITGIALINPKLYELKLFSQPRQRDDNVVGVKDTDDPEDGHEESQQDHDDQDSPRKAQRHDAYPPQGLHLNRRSNRQGSSETFLELPTARPRCLNLATPCQSEMLLQLVDAVCVPLHVGVTAVAMAAPEVDNQFEEAGGNASPGPAAHTLSHHLGIL